MIKENLSLRVLALAPVLALGPALTCGIPRIMAPLFIACAILSILADGAMRKAKPTLDKRLAALFGAFLVLGTMSFFWNINPGEVFSKAAQLAALFIPAALLTPVIGRMERQELKHIGFLAGLGLGLGIGVHFIERMFDFPFYDTLRGGSTKDVIDNKANKPAVLIALWLFMTLAYVKEGRVLILAALAAAATGYATWLSPSGSAKIVLAGAVFYGIFICLTPPRLSAAATFIMTVLLALSMPVIAQQVATKTAWQTSPHLNSSIKSRIEIWDQTARRSFEKPIFGWGLNASPKIPNRDDKSYGGGVPVHHMHPHNALMQVWVELGAAGVALLCALFWVFHQRIRGMDTPWAQRYGVFMWGTAFAYTLSIWGIWQTWFTATLVFTGLMTYAGMRHMELQKAPEKTTAA